ncbi:MAG: RnfABCDGE type electron transport complex subunit D [Spirochaetaceae bacterium]|jgi:electron transport complex protein RnfD|nr:RnfABCDGE type electron transport complex subunit D [Spirochaetaceae bacterium]
MAENDKTTLVLLQSSPHIASPVNARSLMCNVLIALAPATIYGIVIFGVPALANVLVSVAAAMAAETLFRYITRQDIRTGDLSAAVTGLLLALVIPPATPLWMTALGSAFAVVVAKEFFGGLGANVFNPALIGRAFLIMSFPAAITTWAVPRGAVTEALTGATPLGILKTGGAVADVGRNFAGLGLAASADYWDTIKTLFIGNHGGSTGETSILLILAGCVFLLITKTIDWRAPASMAAGAVLTSLILGLDPLFALLSGGLIFGAVFMITDYVSAPVTPAGKLIFGFGAGVITMLIRKFGAYPEGTSYGILIMNAAVPFLNRFLQKKYGFVAKKGAA